MMFHHSRLQDPSMKRFSVIVVALSAVLGVTPARAQDAGQTVSYFYPLRTRPAGDRARARAARAAREKRAAGRTTEAAAAPRAADPPRRQVELEVAAHLH